MLALLATLLIGGPSAEPGSAAGIAKLAIAQRVVEGKAPGAADFQTLKAGDEIEAGTTLRSKAGVQAAIDFSDATELRISENTEILIESARKLTIVQGRLYVRVLKGAAPFEIQTPLHPISADACVMDLTFIPRVTNGPPALTTIMVLEGKAKAYSKKFSPFIFAGWVGSGFGAVLNTPDSIGNGSLSTAWVHSLLVERGKSDDEIATRTDELISIMSNITPNDPVEAALKSLGALAVPALVRFMSRSDLPTQVERRAAATRLLSEFVPLKSAKDLVGLLRHPEAEVRILAARGLTRLAGGKDFGFNDGFWKGDARDAGLKAWEEWVKQNVKG